MDFFFEKRYSNTVLGRKTDFVLLAEAFGARGYRAKNVEEFDEAMKTAMSLDGPVVIEALVEKDEFVLPMLPPGGAIDDMIVGLEELQK